MLSLVVPFFNEQEKILKSYKILKNYLEKNIHNYELIFVNDGSTDDSYNKLNKIIGNTSKTKLINYKTNQGRGYAVTFGFKHANGDFIGYIDADLEISPKYIKKALNRINEYDVVIANKHLFASKITTTKLRKITSLIFNYLMKIILKSKISDHQTGLKIFNKYVIKKVLPLVKSNGWFFDVELLYYIQKFGFRVYEMPINIKYGFGKVKWSFIKGFIYSIYLAFNLKIRNNY